MSLTDTARKLYALFKPHGVVIGGICATVHGVERFTRDVDMATDLSPDQVMEILGKAGIQAELVRSDASESLSWVVRGADDGIPFQLLPAGDIGVDPNRALIQVEIGFACEQDFIVSKCIAGGQQDLHDVAVLVLKRPDLQSFAEAKAGEHGCRDKLEAWLGDQRLRSRYGPRAGKTED